MVKREVPETSESLEDSASQLSAHRPRSSRSIMSRGSPSKSTRSYAHGDGGTRDCLVRFCAASCMLGVIAITAALASLAASLYGQGKLSVDDAWQLVPPVLVPAAVTVGAESRQLGQEVLKLKQELHAMQAEALNKAKRRRAREGANATDSNSRELEDEEDGDGHTASVRSLQRQLSQNIAQLETARQQLGDEQRMTRELEESKRRLASDLQARETELLTIRRDSEASLKDLLKSEVARARDETEAKMKHEHLTSKHLSVEQVVTRLEEDLRAARAEGKGKDVQVQGLRTELVRIRSALADEDTFHNDMVVTAVGGGEVALAKTMRAEVKRLSEESRTLRKDLALERDRRIAEEAARLKVENEFAATKISAGMEAGKRRVLEDKLTSELEAKLHVKIEAAENLLVREKKLADECDSKLVTAREAAATVCNSECASKVTRAHEAAATACSAEWAAKVSSATVAATSATATAAETECNTRTEKLRASHGAEMAAAAQTAETAAANHMVELAAANAKVVVCETQLQEELKMGVSAGDEVAKCGRELLECSLQQESLTAQLQTCRDSANATFAQATNKIEQAAAELRHAETAMQEAQLKMAGVEAQRQQAEAGSHAAQLDVDACRTQLEACNNNPCASALASASGAAAPIKALSPDMLTLSTEALPAGEHGESESDSESCGLTPATCGGAPDTPGTSATNPSAVYTATAAKTAAVQLMSAPELEANIAKHTREGGVMFVKFFAPWCGHCKKLAPVWDQVGEAFLSESNVTIAKADCTQAQDLCQRLGVEGLPTLTLFSNGSPLAYTGKKDLNSLIVHVNSFVLSKVALPSVETFLSPAAMATNDMPRHVEAAPSDDGALCGLSPGSCSDDRQQSVGETLSVGSGGATNSSSAPGEMSDAEIAAVYDRVKNTASTGALDSSSAASARSATPAASPQFGKLKPDAPASEIGKHLAPHPSAPASPAAALSAENVTLEPDAQKAQEAQRRWEDALKNDPKRAEQMEYRARRAAGPALTGSDEEKGGTEAENKFCQSLAGAHAIFDGKEGGCRCKQGYTEDDEGKCIAEHSKAEEKNEVPPAASPQSSASPGPALSATPAKPAAGAGGADAGGSEDAKGKAAEAQRRWEEALKNDPKRAEQMEYRARRAAGPALTGSDEEKGGTEAENKFCQSLAGAHAIFDGKEGGCRCKQGYTEDDEGKCIAEQGVLTVPIAAMHDSHDRPNMEKERKKMEEDGRSGAQSLGGLDDDESLGDLGGLGSVAYDSLGALGSLEGAADDKWVGTLGSLDYSEEDSLGSLVEREDDSLGGFGLSEDGGVDSLGALGSL